MEGRSVLLITAFVLNILVLCSATPKYKDCGSVKGKVLAVNVSAPFVQNAFQLKKGDSVEFDVKFTSNEVVTKSTAKVYGMLGPAKIPFPIPNTDGCKDSGLSCPLKSGQNYEYKSNIPVKKVFPDVKVVVEWYLNDQSGEVIWCVAVPVKIVG
ncbi:hypothetical protein SNE40_009880 [Patella caerulea]|uniref:MD-2-related lipid-recognition domain-containing protein n=1 Tax=Patella caerulea TaxID=87958 RepID=A0AAN8JU74_PATCE